MRCSARRSHQQRALEQLRGRSRRTRWSTGPCPLSLGDSLHGFPVLGTTPGTSGPLYGYKMPLHGMKGRLQRRLVDSVLKTVLGADVNANAGLPGRRAHHAEATASAAKACPSTPTNPSPSSASSQPYRVTPVDRTVRQACRPSRPSTSTGPAACRCWHMQIPPNTCASSISPKTITAVLVGLKKSRCCASECSARSTSSRASRRWPCCRASRARPARQLVGVAEAHAAFAVSGDDRRDRPPIAGIRWRCCWRA